jgi:hypothetical protein
VLLEFPHGLGDAMQLTSVLRHLQQIRTDLEVSVRLGRGKHSACRGLCRQLYLEDEPAPQQLFNVRLHLDWWEPDRCYEGVPSTKAEKCLREVFHMQPRPELVRYVLQAAPEDEAEAEYHCAFDRPLVLLHYEGNTSCDRKNLSHETARAICEQVYALGHTPLVLDWDDRSPVPDQRRVFCWRKRHPYWRGTSMGDAGLIAALCRRAALVVAVDSGPLHVAVATDTPTIAIWRGHHPVHYCCPSPNALHLVPSDHEGQLREPRELGRQYFTANYRFRTYTTLEDTVRETLTEALT